MAEHSSIEWTNHTFNPWTGCAKISPGCGFCYAAGKPAFMRSNAEWGPATERIHRVESAWMEPLRWARSARRSGVRRRVFCGSMMDVGEARRDLDEARDRLMALIALTPELDWMLLTKRPGALGAYLSDPGLYKRVLRAADFFRARQKGLSSIPISDPARDLAVWWPHLWVGASVENDEVARTRVPELHAIPARVRFLSMEPLLGEVDVERYLTTRAGTPLIQWVIVGGESGPKARPMHPDWARAVRDDCAAVGVPFFFKQWGEWGPGPEPLPDSPHPPAVVWDHGEHRTVSYRLGVDVTGRELDGVVHDAYPAPRAAVGGGS